MHKKTRNEEDILYLTCKEKLEFFRTEAQIN